jgi:hypothetical protein
VLDRRAELFLDLVDLVDPVECDVVAVELRARAGVGDLGQVAVRIVGIPVGLPLVVGVAGVVTDQLDRVGDDGAAAVVAQRDLVTVAFGK